MRTLYAACLLCAIAACTSIQVTPSQDLSKVERVCIVDNPKVTIAEFVGIIRDGFSRHNIATEVLPELEAKACQVTLTYTAMRSWDMATYLSHAELRLWREGKQVGFAQYHLNGKGGFALNKWKSSKSKMDPVIDQLLATTGK